MAPPYYYRCWEVWLRGERLGEVLAATQEAACLRAIKRFGIKPEDRRDVHIKKGDRDANS
jgi:RNA:NAD 2'-phosphotransferase (TPT1/KptA family)